MEDFQELLPAVCEWAKTQERRIMTYGQELTDDQKIDAYLVGVKGINKVRLLAVEEIPIPEDEALKAAGIRVGLLSEETIGVTYGHGIYIKKEWWDNRVLIVHEMVHTSQYERLGGIDEFMKEYLTECITLGYPNGPLEKEAEQVAEKICK